MADKFHYSCPVRGGFDSHSKEEEYLIECVKYLIKNKKVPVEYIAIQKTIQKLGAAGRNSLEPDILVFDRPVSEAIINNKVNSDYVRFVAEIKVSPKDKTSAIKDQLYPAMCFCKNVKWGIYWDEASRLAVNKNKEEFSLAHLPKFNEDTKTRLNRDDLTPIDRGVAVWGVLDQALRNHQGSGKKQLYKEIFKLLISKYYDEAKNDPMMFCVRHGDDDNLYERISKLYEKAKNYYRLEGDFKEIVASDITLREKALKACVSILESYSLVDTDRFVIQEFYMKFAPHFLQQDLQQYYTPKELIDFMTQNIKITKKTTAIDPCSGSGDFMVGLLRKADKKNIKADIENELHCWDIDDTAATLAKMNMILNGDGRTNVLVLDSLDKFDKDNNHYEFVITNPPFGKDTKYTGNRLKDYKIIDNKTGKLFIERGLNLLAKKGVLISVIPTGYLDNPSDSQFRDIIFSRSRFLGCINLPSGAFKSSGAGGATSIIFIQNTPPPSSNYRIFTAVANSIGFDTTKKTTPPLLRRRERDGVFVRDENNTPLINNDLDKIAEKLKSFADDENLNKFEKPKEHIKYNFTTYDCIRNNGLAINSKLYDNSTKYPATIKQIKGGNHFLLTGDDISISNNDNININTSKIYEYIDTGAIYKDNIKEIKNLRGWELPNRAKQKTNIDDIFIAKMYTSLNNFFYVFPKYKNVLISNGFYKIQIQDREKLLCFYRFLFTKEYFIQALALTTGSIMADIKIKDLESGLYIPYLPEPKLREMESFVESKARFVEMGIL